jgi:hypothetical protein
MYERPEMHAGLLQARAQERELRPKAVQKRISQGLALAYAPGGGKSQTLASKQLSTQRKIT